MEQARVCDQIAEVFLDEGVRALFTLFGDGNLAFVDAVASAQRARVVHARHEAAAVFMASGYARATGKVAAASVTTGPGLAHTMTPLVAASRAKLPLVLYAGDTGGGGPHEGGLQDFEHAAFAKAAEVCHVRAGRDDAGEAARRAFSLARQRSLPVILSVPEGLMELSTGQSAERNSHSDFRETKDPMTPDVRQVAEEVHRLVTSAHRPLLVVGSGAMDPGSLETVRCLARRNGGYVGTTFRGKGQFDDDPANVGIVGPLAHAAHQRSQEEADLVVGFGANLHGFGSFIDTLYGTNTVCVGVERHGGWRAEHPGGCTAFRQPAAEVLRVLAELVNSSPHRPPPPPSPARAEVIAADFAELPEVSEHDQLDPRRLILALDERIADDATIVIGGGHFWSFPMMYLSRRDRRFVFPLEFGSIGMALPTGLGMAAATPEREVVVFEGDGGVAASIQEIETGVRAGLRMSLVVLNDAALGAEFHKLKAKGLAVTESYYRPVDFAAIGETFGARSAVARTVDDVAAFASREAGLFVLDARVSRSVTSRWYRRLYLGEIQPFTGREPTLAG